jgi:Membrane bound beta barrel domain (DUF5777)
MNTSSNSIKTLCAIALITGIFSSIAHAQDAVKAPTTVGQQGDTVARLEAELKATKAELMAAQAQAAEQSRRIAQLEAQLKGAAVAQLEKDLKTSKDRIAQLEEDLFVATDGKGVKGKEVVEELPEGTYAWTENMRRLPIGVLFPKTMTIPSGDFYARFSHTSQNQTFANGGRGDAFHDMLGLESGVKVGILFGYGITKDWDVTLQRTNGRDYIKNGVNYESGSYDLWDLMTKYHLLDENKHFVDLSVAGGVTYFCQEDWSGMVAGNGALLVEKSIWRFRVGSGLLYTSQSDYDAARSSQKDNAPEKRYPRAYRGVFEPVEENHTVAVPLSLSFALTKSHQLFSEFAVPVSGYQTENDWPSMAAGWRYNTPTHAYSIYFANTANGSFNSNFTGGYMAERLDLFGFEISIFF